MRVSGEVVVRVLRSADPITKKAERVQERKILSVGGGGSGILRRLIGKGEEERWKNNSLLLWGGPSALESGGGGKPLGREGKSSLEGRDALKGL